MRAGAFAIGLAAVMLLAASGAVFSHCDTLDGPVAVEARAALEKGDMTPVLKWVKPEGEAEVKAAFTHAVAIRGKGEEIRQLADTYFLETLIRIHRAGEGAPYTGLKPAGTDAGPAVKGADKALETGNADALVKLVTDAVAEGIRKRFMEAKEAKGHADHNVDAGRHFVAAYVEFVHYAERLYNDAHAGAAHGHEAEQHAGDQE